MTVIFFLQLALPLFFIGLIALAPLKSTLGFCCQVVGTGTALFALALTGLWLFPPWWTPYVFAGLYVAAVVVGWRRRYPFAARLPLGWIAWILMAVFVALGGWGVYQSASALAGRVPQAGRVIDLVFPLKGGTYLVVSGGSRLNINPHLMTLDASMARLHAYRGQSYGVDVVKVHGWGLRASGLQPSEPSAYNIYGVPVYAPCAGIVVIAIDGLPDMQVPLMDRTHMAGNHVLLRCTDADADVLLGHLKPGSVRIAVGNPVAVGDHIGNVGNTGNTGEPHLHIHAQERGTASEPLSGNPLPMRFDGRFLVRNDRVRTR
jgi:Peptidase family M23